MPRQRLRQASLRVADKKYQPGLGAELSASQQTRAGQLLGDLVCALLK
jgi:hypothetical protein